MVGFIGVAGYEFGVSKALELIGYGYGYGFCERYKAYTFLELLLSLVCYVCCMIIIYD